MYILPYIIFFFSYCILRQDQGGEGELDLDLGSQTHQAMVKVGKVLYRGLGIPGQSGPTVHPRHPRPNWGTNARFSPTQIETAPTTTDFNDSVTLYIKMALYIGNDWKKMKRMSFFCE